MLAFSLCDLRAVSSIDLTNTSIEPKAHYAATLRNANITLADSPHLGIDSAEGYGKFSYVRYEHWWRGAGEECAVFYWTWCIVPLVGPVRP